MEIVSIITFFALQTDVYLKEGEKRIKLVNGSLFIGLQTIPNIESRNFKIIVITPDLVCSIALCQGS